MTDHTKALDAAEQYAYDVGWILPGERRTPKARRQVLEFVCAYLDALDPADYATTTEPEIDAARVIIERLRPSQEASNG